MQRRHQAFRAKNNRQPGMFQRLREREIVAGRAIPVFHHVRIVKCAAPDGRTASPTEVFSCAA